MAWISFGPLLCRGKKKTWGQLASRCCWNRARPLHASELVSFLVGLRTYQQPGSTCLLLLSHFPVPFVLPSICPPITRFRRQFLRKMKSVQLFFLRFNISRMFFSPWLCVTLLHFSRDRSFWSSPFFSSTTFQNCQGISDLLSKVSKFQQHKKLYYNCRISSVSYLNLNLACWWKDTLCWMPLLPCRY